MNRLLGFDDSLGMYRGKLKSMENCAEVAQPGRALG
jgi:hypothetical protein